MSDVAATLRRMRQHVPPMDRERLDSGKVGSLAGRVAVFSDGIVFVDRGGMVWRLERRGDALSGALLRDGADVSRYGRPNAPEDRKGRKEGLE